MINGQTRFVLDELAQEGIKSVLNIGFRYDSDKTVRDSVHSRGGTFSVLEVYGPNCADMRIKNTADTVYEKDVRNIAELDAEWDAIIWLHGPEHVYWNEFVEIREEIEKKAKKLVLYQAPIGEYPQDALYGNPYEKHVEALTPEMFWHLGYEIVVHNGKKTHAYDFVEGELTFSAVHRVEG